MIIGPDVSFYQDDNETPQQIDFAKMKANGAKFVIIRAGQNLWADPDFDYNWQAAKDAGLPRGCYWFFDSRADPKKQATLWDSTVPWDDKGELPHFADLEETYNGPYRGWKNWYNFLEHFKTFDDVEIGIYTAPYYWKDNAPSPIWQKASLNYFLQYPLWIANYQVEKPMIPAPWSEWLLWQYTAVGDGKGYGTESKGIDLNYFNGDEAAFLKRFGLNSTQPPVEDPSVQMRRAVKILYDDGTEQNIEG